MDESNISMVIALVRRVSTRCQHHPIPLGLEQVEDVQHAEHDTLTGADRAHHLEPSITQAKTDTAVLELLEAVLRGDHSTSSHAASSPPSGVCRQPSASSAPSASL